LQEFADFVGKVGFPIFVAVFLLVRIDPLLRDLTTAIRELVTVVKADRSK